VRAAACLIAVCIASASAHADTTELKPIVGFRVRGDSKLRERTLGFLAHIAIGDYVSDAAIPKITAALISSELFKKVTVTLEEAPGGYLVVATLDDKHSWFAAPTLYLLGERRAVGAGFIENNLGGFNQKLLLYAQYGSHESILFATYLDPSVSGTPFTWRFDIYGYRRQIDEYANPTDDATDESILRTTEVRYLGLGFQAGFTLRWWLVADLRLRGGKMSYHDPHGPDGERLPFPQDNGWDVSTQGRITLDARKYRFGVRWGPYLQLYGETTIPGLDDYDYSSVLFRAYYSWRLFEEHQLELRTNLALGRNLPIHNDLLLGGAVDLRGYTVDRFRGDTRAFFRVEYSVPITKWRMFAFRAVWFWDSGFIGWYRPRKDVLDGGDRTYFYPNMERGTSWFRNDVGAGFRIYVKSVVRPLLGIDFAYGIEGEAFSTYFQLGLVDF
jgi:outer membrane protein assembly factor BamA